MGTTKLKTCLLAAVLAGTIGCKSDDTIKQPDSTDDPGESACPWDEDDDIEAASDLSLDTPEEGYLCPIGDKDHYRFNVSSGQNLLQVLIDLGEEMISINPTYIIYSEDGEKVIGQPAASESAEMGSPLSIIHAIEPGTYILRIHDSSSDATDNYHPYTVTLTGMTDADDNEPNDGAEAATALSGSATGYLSYRGDEDWYQVTASDQEILEITLSMPDESIAPTYRIEDEDGNEIVRRTNDDGLFEVNYLEPLTTAGTYYLIVYHEDELSFDPEVEYNLSISTISDPDDNEPNDVVAEATPLSAGSVTCGQEWTTMTGAGYIASSGDTDWFKVDLSGSDGALIDVNVTFANGGSLPDDFQAAVRLVHAADGNTCTQDQDCLELENNGCVEDIECTRIGNTCLDRGLCAGAGVCLPTGICGATLISRASAVLETSDPEYDPGAPVTPESVSVAAPLFGFSTMYIAVNDHKNDSLSLDHRYTLTVKVAKDTDVHEPSEAYINEPPLQDDSNNPHLEFATPIQIHDCTQDNSACCGAGATWYEGAISYTFDQDWYQYEHPCPEADCLLQVHYQIDEGPTDVLMAVHVGGYMWYDTIVPVSDTGAQSIKNGTFGDDECFYAYHDHSSYYFSVRDTIYLESGGEANNGTWDWSREQPYRFCIAKYYEGCSEPCHDWGEDNGGCGPPEEEDAK